MDSEDDGYETWSGRQNSSRGEYIGTMLEMGNIPHGNGSLQFHNGDHYQGGFRKGRFHGVGALRVADDHGKFREFAHAVCHWSNGIMQGEGVLQYANADTYAGELQKGVKHGLGRFLCFEDGSCYEGWWYLGKKHGFGVLRYANGDYYIGTWKEGFYHGQGIYGFISSGDRFSGHVEKDCFVGTGMLYECNKNSVFVGEFAEDDKTPFGVNLPYTSPRMSASLDESHSFSWMFSQLDSPLYQELHNYTWVDPSDFLTGQAIENIEYSEDGEEESEAEEQEGEMDSFLVDSEDELSFCDSHHSGNAFADEDDDASDIVRAIKSRNRKRARLPDSDSNEESVDEISHSPPKDATGIKFDQGRVDAVRDAFASLIEECEHLDEIIPENPRK